MKKNQKTYKNILISSLLLTACAGAGPQQAAVAWGEALEADDPEAAWAQLDPEVQAGWGYERFVAEWPELRQQQRPLAEALEASGETPARLRAEVTYTPYERVQLRLGEAGWRITGGVFEGIGQQTPRDALLGFMRALEARDGEALLRYAPSTYAQHMSAGQLQADLEARGVEIDELVSALQQAQDAPITERGPRAWLRYGEREITFVREGEVWKVEAPE